MRSRVLALVIILLVAGCSSTPQTTSTATLSATPSPSPSSSTATPIVTPTPTRSPTRTATPTPSTTPTPAPPNNPWRSDPIVVALDDRVGDDSIERSLTEAIAFWNGNIGDYSGFAGRFVYRPNATEPDVILVHKRQVICGGEERAIGCAPYFQEGEYELDPPTEVAIEAGYTRANTTRTIEHEFGHVLGIPHNSSPMPLMAPSHDVTYRDRPDAHERANPWYTANLTAYVEYKDGWYDNQKREYKDELQHTLDYYGAGADGHVPENVSVSWVDNRSAAHIVFEFPEEPPCAERDEAVSCYNRFGHDLDIDAALEYHVNVTISFTGIERRRVAWHAGYWLGFALGAENVSDLPPPFDEPESDPREEWWTK